MSLWKLPRSSALVAGFALALGLLAMAGCSGEKSGPTKIYEGGGTIPEIVDQPEPPEPKKSAS